MRLRSRRLDQKFEPTEAELRINQSSTLQVSTSMKTQIYFFWLLTLCTDAGWCERLGEYTASMSAEKWSRHFSQRCIACKLISPAC
jgi:hypothetical protein